MEYPVHTESMPVVGQEAALLLAAIDSGSVIQNDEAQATVKRIVVRRLSKSQRDFNE